MAAAGTLWSPNSFSVTFPATNLASFAGVGRKPRRPSVVVCSIPSSSSAKSPLRYAVLGAGFAGLSVAYHLLKQSPRDSQICVDIYDEVGLGGGASGVAGGLLHPYSPKAKLLWRGDECWKECLELLAVAEEAAAFNWLDKKSKELDGMIAGFIVRRRGMLRPAMSVKNLTVLSDNARNSLPSCRIESLSEDSANSLIPNLCLPCKSAFYLPDAVNINPLRYLKALFAACQNLVLEASSMGIGEKEMHLHRVPVNNIIDLASEYTSVIVCLGAQADLVPELSGKLPVRTCRGVIAHMKFPETAGKINLAESPSILSDAWLAVQSSNSLYLGATWDWKSRNYSRDVSPKEAAQALEQLIPKASAIYPSIRDWTFIGAMAGVRAMPPLTASNGSLPLLGCIDDLVTGNHSSKFWFFGGLGSRGLLYHALLGKLTANAVLSCDEKMIPWELTSWK